MDRLRNEVLSGAGFSLEQDRRHFTFGDLCCETQHLFHCWRFTHDLSKVKLPLTFFSDLRYFSPQLTGFNRVADCDAEFFQIDWLADEIVGAAAQSRDGIVDLNI